MNNPMKALTFACMFAGPLCAMDKSALDRAMDFAAPSSDIAFMSNYHSLIAEKCTYLKATMNDLMRNCFDATTFFNTMENLEIDRKDYKVRLALIVISPHPLYIFNKSMAFSVGMMHRRFLELYAASLSQLLEDCSVRGGQNGQRIAQLQYRFQGALSLYSKIIQIEITDFSEELKNDFITRLNTINNVLQ